METALVLRVPEADPIVADWRMKHDPSAPLGMPAHVTVLFPFMPIEHIGTDVVAKLESLIPLHDVFDISFDDVKRFPGTLWLAPEPAGPIIALTEALQRGFPDYPMYGGAFAEIIPHLTVAQGDTDLLDHIEPDLRKKIARPIQACLRSLTLYARDANGWGAQREFPLRAAT